MMKILFTVAALVVGVIIGSWFDEYKRRNW